MKGYIVVFIKIALPILNCLTYVTYFSNMCLGLYTFALHVRLDWFCIQIYQTDFAVMSSLTIVEKYIQ